ncbi:MAG: hypothetical protein IJB50_03140 [Clostridia bacterium]|nr:hypothetical protein [Clostridia bacterium]
MVKTYINGNIITVNSGKKNIEYLIGSGATSLCSKWDFENPYALFSDFDDKELKAFAKAELSKLIALDSFSLNSLAEFDQNRKNSLYVSKKFTLSLEFDEKIKPCFTLKSAKELFALEILTSASLNKPLKICENCGEFFFPSGRADSVYCDRITQNGYSCKKIGAHRQYRRNSSLNEMKKLYDKVTKHNRYLKSKGTLSAYEYDNWMSQTSQKYADFKADEISAPEFEAWLLGKEFTPTKRTKSKNTISDYLL